MLAIDRRLVATGAATLATAAALAALWYRRYRRIHELDAMPPRITSCTLRWGHSSVACFCRPSIRLDLQKLTPDAELIAAIFGSPPADGVVVTRADGHTVDPTHGLKMGEIYDVRLTESALADLRKAVPIKQIAKAIGSEAAVATLSHAFYTRVWADEDAKVFRA